MSSPTVVFFRPNNAIAVLWEIKKKRVLSDARPIVVRLEACNPNNPVCLHLRGDQPRGTAAQEVRHQSFELRHDSIGGKVTMGYEGSQKSSDHHRSEIRSIVMEPPGAF